MTMDDRSTKQTGSTRPFLHHMHHVISYIRQRRSSFALHFLSLSPLSFKAVPWSHPEDSAPKADPRVRIFCWQRVREDARLLKHQRNCCNSNTCSCATKYRKQHAWLSKFRVFAGGAWDFLNLRSYIHALPGSFAHVLQESSILSCNHELVSVIQKNSGSCSPSLMSKSFQVDTWPRMTLCTQLWLRTNISIYVNYIPVSSSAYPHTYMPIGSILYALMTWCLAFVQLEVILGDRLREVGSLYCCSTWGSQVGVTGYLALKRISKDMQGWFFFHMDEVLFRES